MAVAVKTAPLGKLLMQHYSKCDAGQLSHTLRAIDKALARRDNVRFIADLVNACVVHWPRTLRVGCNGFHSRYTSFDMAIQKEQKGDQRLGEDFQSNLFASS